MALVGTAGTAAAANPLRCFDGTTDTATGQTGGVIYGGRCTLNAAGTGATLDNSVAVGAGDYSGVYFATSSLSGKPLAQVSDLSFTYTGTPTAGSPRISLPIDTNGDGTTDFYAFIGAFVAAHLTWSVSSSVPFVIADDAGIWTVDNVHLGPSAATGNDKKAACKNGGWATMTRTDGSSFRNQGDCIQWVNTGK